MPRAPRRRVPAIDETPVDEAPVESTPERPGRNAYDPPSPESVVEYLDETQTDLIRRRDEIQGGIDRFLKQHNPIGNADIRARAGDFAGSKGAINSFIRATDAERVKQKQPYDQAGSAVQGWFKTLVQGLEKGMRDIRQAMTDWDEKQLEIQREAARKQAEAAAQAAREAEQAAMKTMQPSALDQAAEAYRRADAAAAHAEAPAAEHTRTTGQLGTTTSLHSHWAFDEQQSDLMALVKAVAEGREPLHYLAFNSSRIGYAVRSERVRQIAGCAIVERRQSR